MSAAELPEKTDFLVIGAGVIGVSVALEIKRRYGDCSVTVIEKEPRWGLHASGRNSGVLHAGFYYHADSLKARLTREGNQRMREYCEERQLPVNPCGKLVVANDEQEYAGLNTLWQRGRANDVPLQWLTPEQATDIEPRVKAEWGGLFSPTTVTVDPGQVMDAMAGDLQECGATVVTDCAYRGRTRTRVRTSRGDITAGYVVNSAGLYADRIAHDYGFGRDYRLLAFKGLYLYAKTHSDAPRLRTNIYPVPDLANPFLGVHFTVDVEGRSKIGPTAVPCLWREQYGGFANFRRDEALESVVLGGRLWGSNRTGFRNLARREIMKYFRPSLVAQAGRLLHGVRLQDYPQWGRPGIRAQLVHLPSMELEMDFLHEGDSRSMHILNVVSPAFTCALSLAEFIADRMERFLAGSTAQTAPATEKIRNSHGYGDNEAEKDARNDLASIRQGSQGDRTTTAKKTAGF